MNKTLTWLVIIAIVVIGGFLLFGGDSSAPAEDEVTDGDTMMKAAVVTYTERGYEPASLTVNVGDTVTFKNESFDRVWTASAQHPTHTVYPGSDIKKCGAEETQEGIFDQCVASSNGEEWSFTFDEVGEWGYHNHLRSGHFGKIIVQ